MSYRTLILSAFVLLIGLGTTTVAMANPTCQCDVICSRLEQRCLNLGGTVDQCVNAYDNCSLQCGDPWPCGSTCSGGGCPSQLTQTDAKDLLGLDVPFWRTAGEEIVTHAVDVERAEKKTDASQGDS